MWGDATEMLEDSGVELVMDYKENFIPLYLCVVEFTFFFFPFLTRSFTVSMKTYMKPFTLLYF